MCCNLSRSLLAPYGLLMLLQQQTQGVHSDSRLKMSFGTILIPTLCWLSHKAHSNSTPVSSISGKIKAFLLGQVWHPLEGVSSPEQHRGRGREREGKDGGSVPANRIGGAATHCIFLSPFPGLICRHGSMQTWHWCSSMLAFKPGWSLPWSRRTNVSLPWDDPSAKLLCRIKHSLCWLKYLHLGTVKDGREKGIRISTWALRSAWNLDEKSIM